MEIRRSGDRFVTSSDWLESRHSFSFGPHYDPANIGFGFLVAHNDEVVAPGKGFAAHPHQDLRSSPGYCGAPSRTRIPRGIGGTSTPGSRSG